MLNLRSPVIFTIMSLSCLIVLRGAEPISHKTASGEDSSILWHYKEYSTLAQDENLADFLQSFFRSQKMPAKLYADFAGIKVNGDFKKTTPQAFLNTITQAYGLTWFFDGNMLHIDKQDTMRTVYLNLKTGHSADRLRDLIDKLSIRASDYTIRFLESNDMFYISGPKQFVDNIEEIINLENFKEESFKAELVVRIFPLKHTYAQDISVNYNNQTITIPGVSTMLHELMNGMGPGAELDHNDLQPSPTKLKGKGMSLQRPNTNTSANKNKNKEDDESSQDPEKKPGHSTSTANVFIKADVRSNSVIIRDKLEQMEFYQELIEQLDQPQKIITITAAIIDVNSDFSQEFGNEFFNWNQTGAKNGSLSIGPAGASSAPSSGFNIAGRIVPNSNQFMVNVQALEKQGRAKVLSRPSVVTFNNIEAIISQDETFYVRVNGDREVDLYDVHVGTVMRVTPSIVASSETEGNPQIRLLINIQDGSNLSDTVDGIPRSKKSFINTQAVVGQDQSLLVGGYFIQRETENESGIPFLRRLPILGYAFKSKIRSTSTSERMFLISPKIVSVEDLHTKENDAYIKKPGPLSPKPAVKQESSLSLQTPEKGKKIPVHMTAKNAFSSEFWLNENDPSFQEDRSRHFRLEAQKNKKGSKANASHTSAASAGEPNPGQVQDAMALALCDNVLNLDVDDPAMQQLQKAQDSFLLKIRLASRFRGKGYRSALCSPACMVAGV